MTIIMRPPTLEDPRTDFERIHDAGTKRHPETWFTANRAAATHAAGMGLDLSDEGNKTLVSEIVLRVLDAVDAA